MHKTADFHSNLLGSWELVTEGYQGRHVKCVHFERPLPDMVILWFPYVPPPLIMASLSRGGGTSYMLAVDNFFFRDTIT